MSHAYEGFYARFESPDKKAGSMMMGADDLVGDRYSINFKVEDGVSIAWLANKFGAERGFLSPEDSRRVQLALGRGETVLALLSFLAYSDMPEPGIYWGEMAFVCYNPADENVMQGYIEQLSEAMANGKRPEISMNERAAQKIFETPGWIPTKTVPLPDRKKKGFAILKDHRSASERAIEQGRAGNKGCYFVSIVFIVVVIGALVVGALKMFGVI